MSTQSTFDGFEAGFSQANQSFSSGLGLLDYLNWCEDLNMEPIMAVWSGKFLRANCFSGTKVLRSANHYRILPRREQYCLRQSAAVYSTGN